VSRQSALDAVGGKAHAPTVTRERSGAVLPVCSEKTKKSYHHKRKEHRKGTQARVSGKRPFSLILTRQPGGPALTASSATGKSPKRYNNLFGMKTDPGLVVALKRRLSEPGYRASAERDLRRSAQRMRLRH